MLRTDTGNFNRFLTSLGLLLLVAALLIPYFFFRDTDVLRVPQRELNGLTPVAAEALEARQRRIRDLEVPVVALAIALAVGGVATLILGGRRLRVAQRKEDEAIDRRARRETYEIQQLSSGEVEERRDEQVREVVDEESAAGIEAGQAPAAPASGPPGARVPELDEHGLPFPPPRLRTLEETRIEIARVEKELTAVLEQQHFGGYTYRSGVKIVPDAGPRLPDVSPRQVNVDGLFEAGDESHHDVALELKVTRLSVRDLKARTKAFTDPLLAMLARYNRVTGRQVLGWLLILVPEGAERLSSKERHHVEAHFDQGLAGLGRCAIVHEDDIERLPQLFRELFASRS